MEYLIWVIKRIISGIVSWTPAGMRKQKSLAKSLAESRAVMERIAKGGKSNG